MLLEFSKMSVNGNDFVVFYNTALNVGVGRRIQWAEKVCARRTGVGSDGLIEIVDNGQRIVVRMWNPDGSEDFCGNGLACAAALLASKHPEIHFEMGAMGRVVIADTDHEANSVTINLGAAEFAGDRIPAAIAWTPGEPPPTLSLPDLTLPVYPISTGTAHCVIFYDHENELPPFEVVSPIIEHHPAFPQRTSVLWVSQRKDSILEVRIWERGVGETWSCGTGAAAVGVVALLTGRAQNIVTVSSTGGKSLVSLSPDGSVLLTVSPRIVFTGTMQLDA